MAPYQAVGRPITPAVPLDHSHNPVWSVDGPSTGTVDRNLGAVSPNIRANISPRLPQALPPAYEPVSQLSRQDSEDWDNDSDLSNQHKPHLQYAESHRHYSSTQKRASQADQRNLDDDPKYPTPEENPVFGNAPNINETHSIQPSEEIMAVPPEPSPFLETPPIDYENESPSRARQRFHRAFKIVTEELRQRVAHLRKPSLSELLVQEEDKLASTSQKSPKIPARVVPSFASEPTDLEDDVIGPRILDSPVAVSDYSNGDYTESGYPVLDYRGVGGEPEDAEDDIIEPRGLDSPVAVGDHSKEIYTESGYPIFDYRSVRSEPEDTDDDIVEPKGLDSPLAVSDHLREDYTETGYPILKHRSAGSGPESVEDDIIESRISDSPLAVLDHPTEEYVGSVYPAMDHREIPHDGVPYQGDSHHPAFPHQDAPHQDVPHQDPPASSRPWLKPFRLVS